MQRQAQTALVQLLFTRRETVEGKTTETVFVIIDWWSKASGQWQLLARRIERAPAK